MLRLKTQTKKYKTVNKLITKALIATIYCCAMVLLTLNKMKYYKTGSYVKLIKEVEVTKETDKCIYIKNEYNGKEERVVKLGSYANYFKSYDEAKCFLETKKQIKIEQLEASLKRERLELEEIYNL